MTPLALGGGAFGFFTGTLLWSLLFRSAGMLWYAFKHSPKAPWRYGVMPLLLVFNPLPWLLIGLPYFISRALSGRLPPFWICFFIGVCIALAFLAILAAVQLNRVRKAMERRAAAAKAAPAEVPPDH
ncbi:MAG: hypothetical protein JWR07_478 [Nevskia sp.]|nr:hypothetical protein [Nevskia sp.]